MAFLILIIVFSVYYTILLRKRFINRHLKWTVVGKDIVCGYILSVYMAYLLVLSQ